MKWLAECSPVALREALRVVAPELSGYPVTVPGPAGKQDPVWHSDSVPVGERFIVKFAWSRPAALRLAREIGVLTVLGREPEVPFLPEVVASSTDPVLLITRRVPGTSLFGVVDSIDRDRAARQLAWFLAALHDPAARKRVERAVGTLTGAQLPPATTRTLRDRFPRWARPDQRQLITGWCDWAEAVLASPAVAQRSRNPASRPPDPTRVGAGPSRALHRPRHPPLTTHPPPTSPDATGPCPASNAARYIRSCPNLSLRHFGHRP
jgi:Phosphotransferase enzyme family